jgi:hypothetical protein
MIATKFSIEQDLTAQRSGLALWSVSQREDQVADGAGLG